MYIFPRFIEKPPLILSAVQLTGHRIQFAIARFYPKIIIVISLINITILILFIGGIIKQKKYVVNENDLILILILFFITSRHMMYSIINSYFFPVSERYILPNIIIYHIFLFLILSFAFQYFKI